MAVKHCENHRSYNKGCPDCMVRSAEYQREYKEGKRVDLATHFANGREKDSKEQLWVRFNAMGKRLTNGG